VLKILDTGYRGRLSERPRGTPPGELDHPAAAWVRRTRGSALSHAERRFERARTSRGSYGLRSVLSMICPGRGSTRQRGVLPHGLARGNVSVFRRASIASIALCLIVPLGGVANTAPPSPTTDLAVAAARPSDPVDYAHRGLPVHRSDADGPPHPRTPGQRRRAGRGHDRGRPGQPQHRPARGHRDRSVDRRHDPDLDHPHLPALRHRPPRVRRRRGLGLQHLPLRQPAVDRRPTDPARRRPGQVPPHHPRRHRSVGLQDRHLRRRPDLDAVQRVGDVVERQRIRRPPPRRHHLRLR